MVYKRASYDDRFFGKSKISGSQIKLGDRFFGKSKFSGFQIVNEPRNSVTKKSPLNLSVLISLMHLRMDCF